MTFDLSRISWHLICKGLALACVTAALSSPALCSDDAQRLIGVWLYRDHGVIADADLYTKLQPDGTCFQVAKVSMLRSVKWSEVKCLWELKDKILALRIISSSTQPNIVGKTIDFVLTDLGEDSLQIDNDGHADKWRRVKIIPDDIAPLIQ